MSQTTLIAATPARLAAISPKANKEAPSPPWRPYLELTRFNKPAGLLGFYFPYMIGFFFSANLIHPATLSAADWAKLTSVFLLDGLLLRSFGCAWNDTIDQDLDRQVERCKKRPLARGALTTPAAVATTFILAAARHVLLYATLPPRARQHALLVTVLAFVYPFMKRFCDYPQLCLGTSVGWAVFLVDAAVADSLAAAAPRSDLNERDRSKAVLALFLGQTLFNITYDTVYAFQDLQDDLKAGVRSLAVRVRHHAKAFLLSLVGAMAAFLLPAAFLSGLTRGPYLLGAALAEVAAFSMLVKLNLEDPRSCRNFFVYGQWAVSGVLLAGLVGELVLAKL